MKTKKSGSIVLLLASILVWSVEKMRKGFVYGLFLLVTTLFAGATLSHAVVYGVTSRVNLAGDDSVNWGAQGYGEPYYGGGPYIPTPVSASSENGLGMSLTNPPYLTYTQNGWEFVPLTMSLRKQSLSWFGSFALDNIVIGNQWDKASPPGHGPGPMTIHFDSPVYGLGAQINQFGMYQAGTFTATIEAYDNNWNTLGQVAFNNLQYAGYTADNSAPFIGIVSDTGDISHVVIATSRSAHMINQLDLVTTTPAAFPPAGAVAASPETPRGVRVVSPDGASDTTTGAILTTSETLYESKIPAENFYIDAVVQTDAFNAVIYYNGGSQYSLTTPTSTNPAIGNSFAQMPIDVQIDGVPSSLTGLEGKVVKELKILSTEGSGFVPELNRYYVTKQWAVLASLLNTGVGGGNNQAELSELEGFIDNINDPQITISKEGNGATITVVTGTTITVNGNNAGLQDLQIGDKAKANYDPNTNEAQMIKVER